MTQLTINFKFEDDTDAETARAAFINWLKDEEWNICYSPEEWIEYETDLKVNIAYVDDTITIEEVK